MTTLLRKITCDNLPRNRGKFSSKHKSTAWKRQIISTYFFFVSQGFFDNGTLHKVTYNFHLKIRNILELTTCPVKFGIIFPGVIF